MAKKPMSLDELEYLSQEAAIKASNKQFRELIDFIVSIGIPESRIFTDNFYCEILVDDIRLRLNEGLYSPLSAYRIVDGKITPAHAAGFPVHTLKDICLFIEEEKCNDASAKSIR